MLTKGRRNGRACEVSISLLSMAIDLINVQGGVVSLKGGCIKSEGQTHSGTWTATRNYDLGGSTCMDV